MERNVALLTAYFDESERDDGQTFVIAGCLFTQRQAKAFAADMRQVFEEYGGCHMNRLIAGQPPYHELSPELRAEMVHRSVDIMVDRVEQGVMVVANRKDLENGPPCAFALEKAYGICADTAVTMIEQWLDRQSRQYDEVEYLFADGYTRRGHVSEFRRYMEEYGQWFWRRQTGFGFEPHGPCSPFDASDIAAWEIGRFVQDGEKSAGMRGSLRALFGSGKFHYTIETRASLEAYQAALREIQEERDRRARAG